MKPICLTLFLWVFWANTFAQFQLCNSPTQQTLDDIYFLNRDIGLAVGDSGTILKSTNGGLDWIQIATPVNDEFKQVTFFSDSVGLIMGKYLLRTEDGGNSWQIIGEAENQYYDIEILDSSVAYVSSSSIGLIKTIDQGITWDTLVLNNPDDALGLLSFIDDTVGYSCRYANAPNAKLSKTLDGGNTWTDLIMNSGSENSVLEAFEFISADTGFIGGWYNPYLAKTTNGGSDWTFSQNNDTLNGGQIYDFCFPTPQAYYACGWHNLILKSIDGGLNWNWITPNLQPTQSLRGLFFLNDSLGWVVGTNGTILKTQTNISSTGLESINEELTSVKVYPNPSNSELSISFPTGIIPIDIHLFQADGKLLKTFLPFQPIYIQQPGRYLLQIQTNKGPITKKIIIHSR